MKLSKHTCVVMFISMSLKGFYWVCGLQIGLVSETKSIDEQENLLRFIDENICMFAVFHSTHLRASDCIDNNFPTAVIDHSCLNLNTVKLPYTYYSCFRCARLIAVSIYNFILGELSFNLSFCFNFSCKFCF